MTQPDFSIAKVFSDLAKDDLWLRSYPLTPQGKRIDELKTVSARLALMVVDGLARGWFYQKQYGPTPDAAFEKWEECIGLALESSTITPTDYATVKQRVEAAK